jgi:tetratricopeptide (TPR) repeat protein
LVPKDLNAKPGSPEILRPPRFGPPRRPHHKRRTPNDNDSACARTLLGFLLISAALLLGSGASAAGQKAPATAERYEIEVSFQPEKGFLHARSAVTLRDDQVVQIIEFELNPHLKILDVADAQGRKLDFERSGRLGSPKLSVRLAEPALGGQYVTLTFTYEGVLPWGSLDYITKDGILLPDESRWYPAVDLAAFTRNDISINLPANWYAVSSGGPRNMPAGLAWETARPVSSRSIVALPKHSLICSPPLSKQTRAIAPWTACFLGPDPDSAKPVAAGARELLQQYGKALPAPFPRELLIVQGFPGQRGAVGYSAPGFLVVSEDVVKFSAYPGYAPEFLPHEIAHQWFPIEVTLARQEDGWLAESLAEYLAWRYLQEKDPEQARLMVARAMRDALAPEPLRPLALGLRLFALEGWEITRATLYDRGLLVWRTLETVIDRERVDRALREYYQRYAGRSASISDFRKICEEISGRDLGWFFDYFISGTRIPEIQLRRTAPLAPGEAAGEIVLENVPPDFQVRVEMRVDTTTGAFEHSVAARGEATPFTVTSKDPVTRITLDPNLRILHWTEAARRHRSQRALLTRLGELERGGAFAQGVGICQQALALDPANLAANEQQIRFEMGRLHFRMKRYARAMEEFARVLALGSLDPMDSDLNRAWARASSGRAPKPKRVSK